LEAEEGDGSASNDAASTTTSSTSRTPSSKGGSQVADPTSVIASLFPAGKEQSLLGFSSEKERDEHLRSMLSEAQARKDRVAAAATEGGGGGAPAESRKRRIAELDPSFVGDDYSECYPEYEWWWQQQQQDASKENSLERASMVHNNRTFQSSSYSTVLLEDSDDEDLSKMDPGTSKKKQLHAWDFETEDDWKRYMETREATPKYADNASRSLPIFGLSQ